MPKTFHPSPTQSDIEAIYRSESRRVYASLIRTLRDFDLAEEALQEAFAIAMQKWPTEGIPDNPRAWLVSTGRFKAIDAMRRRGRINAMQQEIAYRMEGIAQSNAAKERKSIEDDRLRLIFTCCHPAIDSKVQIPLTLREVCGLTTEEIASAFLTAPSTMAQRIVRGKAKIRDAGIPFSIPSSEELPERLDGVLSVIYLVFSEGYSASSGASLTRADISSEAIRLGRLLVELLPDTEAIGLLALMLLQESRRLARVDAQGEIVLLEDQDRSLWNQAYIGEGLQLVSNAMNSGDVGVYSIQAAIAAEHARAPKPSDVNWRQITTLYDTLLQIHPSPIVELNRAVALAMRDGPDIGLTQIQSILDRGELTDYHLIYAAIADLNRRANRFAEARVAYERALKLTQQEPEQRLLRKRLKELG